MKYFCFYIYILFFEIGQLHLWTVTAHIVLVYVQNVCITLSGILNTINIKVDINFCFEYLNKILFRLHHSQDLYMVLAEIGLCG